MKVYIDNVNFSSSSGPNTFAHRLANALVSGFDIDLVGPNDYYDAFLCFIEPTHEPRSGSKFVQRLDGIWFKPDQFQTHNDKIKWAYDNAHHVIWQSNFDMQMTTIWWGDRVGTVIHNGISLRDRDINIPERLANLRDKHDRIFVTSANWHRQKRLKENVELFQELGQENDIMLVLGRDPDYHTSDPRVTFLGEQSHETCLQIYSISDWMIHLAWLDHCPNVVIEAISCGCPIICTDSGGTKEIVRENGIILKEDSEYKFELLDYDMPYNLSLPRIQLIKPTIDYSYINIGLVASKYMDVLTG